MKLKLNKQSIINLSSSEMESINGGRGGWSNFRTGHCNYSKNHPQVIYLTVDDNHDGQPDPRTIGCLSSMAAGDNANGEPFTNEEMLTDEI